MPLPDHVIVTDFDKKQVRADICLDVTYEELLEIDHRWSEAIRVANESLAAQGNPRLSFTGWQWRYRGIGEALIEVAVLLSREAGCGGRVLFFALPEAEKFYDLVGLYRLGRERLLNKNMRYEFTIEGADSFLSRQNM